MKAGDERGVAWARRQSGMRAARKGWKRVEARTRRRRSRVRVSCWEALGGGLPGKAGLEVMLEGADISGGEEDHQASTERLDRWTSIERI